MFSTTIDMEVLEEIENFIDSDECNFVQNMNEAGLSFNAMAFVIDAIVKKVANAKAKLKDMCED